MLFLIISLAEINTPAYGRSLEEIRQSNEIRLCIAGSSSGLYSRMGKVFAENLGVKAKIIKPFYIKFSGIALCIRDAKLLSGK